MNGSGLSHEAKILKMYNASDVDVVISYDGTTEQDIIPATGTFILDLQTNNSPHGGEPNIWHVGKYQKIYGKGSAGTGNLYIVGYY